MSGKGLFSQNVIAVIWDFDKTLSPHYMQRPLFEAYSVDEEAFFAEVNRLPAYYARAGVRVQRDTCYLGHLIAYVRAGKLAGLTNARLRELGGQIQFYPGIPELFDGLARILDVQEFSLGDIHLEHYVVSSGLAEMIRGSAVASRLDGIWASEFVEVPAAPGTDLDAQPETGQISQIATFLDNTTKTRALFEINKGIGKLDSISVNDAIPEEERRVPFRNMIYIADGPSDIPSFSVVKKHGGLAYAVYDPSSQDHFAQAVALLEAGRVHEIGPADYRKGTQTEMWLRHQITRIARRMMAQRTETTESKVAKGPDHFHETERIPG